MKYNFEDLVKDSVTGFTGIITAKYDFITGCVQYFLQPEGLTKEGKVKDGATFDEDRLVSIRAKKVSVKLRPTGGPQTNYPSKH